MRQLLEQARTRLRTRIETGLKFSDRQQMISDVLKTAKNLHDSGKENEALAKIQVAIALDPSLKEIKKNQTISLGMILFSGEEKTRNERVKKLLAVARQSFKSGNFDESLKNANKALAWEPANNEAQVLAARAYRALNDLLFGKVNLNLPPRIRWMDSREYTLSEGNRIFLTERVSEASYKLSGLVYYEAPVELSLKLVHYRSGREKISNIESGDVRQTANREIHPLKLNTEKQGEVYITQYTGKYALQPGLSVFVAKATDPATGIIYPSEYAVYYILPFYRTPWLYVALIGLLIAAGGGVYGVRRHRYNKLFMRRFNPYIAGAPVLHDDLFFGREQLLNNILQTIHNNSIMLFGERRIGKTSVQHHLKKRLGQLNDPDYAFYGVFVDLQGIPQERFFITLRDEIFHELAPLLDNADAAPASAYESGYDYRELVEDIRKVLKALAARTEKKIKLVLLIDEVDQLNSYDPRINQRLRSLFMRNFSENLAAVVSGVAIKKHWDGEGSPWYNFFEEVEVKPFRYEDAEKLIEHPIRGIFKLEKGVTGRIIEITECRPYLIQKMCVILINRMHEERRRTITLADVEAVGRPTET